MVCSIRQCTELCLLTLYELLFLGGTFVDLVAVEQRQDNKKGRIFSFVKHVWGRKWGLYIAVCIVPRGMLGGPMHGIAPVNTPRICFLASTFVDLLDAVEQQ